MCSVPDIGLDTLVDGGKESRISQQIRTVRTSTLKLIDSQTSYSSARHDSVIRVGNSGRDLCVISTTRRTQTYRVAA